MVDRGARLLHTFTLFLVVVEKGLSVLLVVGEDVAVPTLGAALEVDINVDLDSFHILAKQHLLCEKAVENRNARRLLHTRVNPSPRVRARFLPELSVRPSSQGRQAVVL